MMIIIIITIINIFKFVAFYIDLSLCIARNNAGVLQVNLGKKNYIFCPQLVFHYNSARSTLHVVS
jgi:hypothetical protein